MDTKPKDGQLNDVKKSQIPQQPPLEPPLERLDIVRIEKPSPEKLASQLIHSPPSPQNRLKKQFDEDSQDTYQQELGEVVEMPKITSNTNGLRSTTLASPKLFVDRKEKLSESVGHKQEIRLPLPVINAGSVRSESTENKSMPVPAQLPNPDQKKMLKRSDTHIIVTNNSPKAQPGAKTKTINKPSP